MRNWANKGIHKLAWVTVVAAIVLAFAWLVIPLYLESAITGLVHTRLSDWLGVPASVSAVDVDLHRRKVGLYGLRIAQPEGVGNGELLYAAEIETVIRLRSLLSGKLDLLETRMAGLELDVYTDASGQSSLETLVDTIRTRQADADTTAGPGEGPLKALSIRSLAATDGTAIFREQTGTNDVFEITLRDIDVDAWDLTWVPQTGSATNKTGLVMVTGRLHQQPLRDGRCGAALETGDLSGAPPSLDCHLRFVGIELASIAPLLPANTAAILGGDAVDLSVDMAINAELLTGQAVIETIAGYRYALTLSGMPTKPTVTTDSDAVAYVLSRTQGGLANVFQNLHWAGKGAAGAVADAVTDLASGTVKTVGSFGQGLLQTAKGVVTFDGSDIGQGSKAMGTAVTGGATDAVFGAGGGIIEGVGRISHGLSGGESAGQWRRQIPTRWKNAWQEAISATVD